VFELVRLDIGSKIASVRSERVEVEICSGRGDK